MLGQSIHAISVNSSIILIRILLSTWASFEDSGCAKIVSSIKIDDPYTEEADQSFDFEASITLDITISNSQPILSPFPSWLSSHAMNILTFSPHTEKAALPPGFKIRITSLSILLGSVVNYNKNETDNDNDNGIK